MKIAVFANDEQWTEINEGTTQADYCRIHSMHNSPAGVDAYLFLRDEIVYHFDITSTPIVINAVSVTLKEMNVAANVVRINGWNGFLSRSTWEVSGPVDVSMQKLFAALGKKIIPVPDEPGFVSARVIAMIINEAYFALEDKLSSEKEIDTAMKLGTNYPHGPFEWASIIGIEKILSLLQKLSTRDKKYLPAALLKAAANA